MIGGHNAALAIKILCFLGSLPTPEKSHKPFSSHHEMLAVRGKDETGRGVDFTCRCGCSRRSALVAAVDENLTASGTASGA